MIVFSFSFHKSESCSTQNLEKSQGDNEVIVIILDNEIIVNTFEQQIHCHV